MQHTKVISQRGIHPMDTWEGPLPMGWHWGKSRGVTYFWNDSGAKQLHYPSAPRAAALQSAESMGADVLMSNGMQRQVSSVYLQQANMNQVDLKSHVKKDTLGTVPGFSQPAGGRWARSGSAIIAQARCK